MNALTHTILIGMIFSTIGCGQSGPDGQLAVSSQQSACKQVSAAERSAASLGAISASASGSQVTILHADATYNCASKLKLEATLAGSEILVQEIITNPGELARCTCPYDLTAVVENLAPGTYTVKVTDAEGNPAGSATVTVGQPAGSLEVSAKQSACKVERAAAFAANDLQATVSAGTLLVTHEDAHYNCAAEVDLVVTLQGSAIQIVEQISNPGVAALCECDFDLTAEVKGLAPGSYTVSLTNADGQLVGTLQVTIP